MANIADTGQFLKKNKNIYWIKTHTVNKVQIIHVFKLLKNNNQIANNSTEAHPFSFLSIRTSCLTLDINILLNVWI